MENPLGNPDPFRVSTIIGSNSRETKANYVGPDLQLPAARQKKFGLQKNEAALLNMAAPTWSSFYCGALTKKASAGHHPVGLTGIANMAE